MTSATDTSKDLLKCVAFIKKHANETNFGNEDSWDYSAQLVDRPGSCVGSIGGWLICAAMCEQIGMDELEDDDDSMEAIDALDESLLSVASRMLDVPVEFLEQFEHLPVGKTCENMAREIAQAGRVELYSSDRYSDCASFVSQLPHEEADRFEDITIQEDIQQKHCYAVVGSY